MKETEILVLREENIQQKFNSQQNLFFERIRDFVQIFPEKEKNIEKPKKKNQRFTVSVLKNIAIIQRKKKKKQRRKLIEENKKKCSVRLLYCKTEIYKTTGTLNLQFMWSYFKYRGVPYNLKQGPVLFIPPARSTIYDTNSVHFRGSLL